MDEASGSNPDESTTFLNASELIILMIGVFLFLIFIFLSVNILALVWVFFNRLRDPVLKKFTALEIFSYVFVAFLVIFLSIAAFLVLFIYVDHAKLIFEVSAVFLSIVLFIDKLSAGEFFSKRLRRIHELHNYLSVKNVHKRGFTVSVVEKRDESLINSLITLGAFMLLIVSAFAFTLIFCTPLFYLMQNKGVDLSGDFNLLALFYTLFVFYFIALNFISEKRLLNIFFGDKKHSSSEMFLFNAFKVALIWVFYFIFF